GPTVEPVRMELLARTASRLGVALTTRTAQPRPGDYEAAFAAFAAEGIGGVLVQGTTLFGRHAPVFGPIAARRRVATICEWDYMARDGCVIGFGPDLVALRRRTGEYVARIFNGADPGELPIEQPDRFILAVNLTAARQLGLELPATF